MERQIHEISEEQALALKAAMDEIVTKCPEASYGVSPGDEYYVWYEVMCDLKVNGEEWCSALGGEKCQKLEDIKTFQKGVNDFLLSDSNRFNIAGY